MLPSNRAVFYRYQPASHHGRSGLFTLRYHYIRERILRQQLECLRYAYHYLIGKSSTQDRSSRRSSKTFSSSAQLTFPNCRHRGTSTSLMDTHIPMICGMFPSNPIFQLLILGTATCVSL